MVKQLIDAVEAVDGEAASGLADGLEFDYAKPCQKPDCGWREKAERERMLTRVAEDAERALRAVERAERLLDEEQVEQAHALLRELVGQDFDVDEDGVPRAAPGTPLRPRRVGSRQRDAPPGASPARSASTATSCTPRRPPPRRR